MLGKSNPKQRFYSIIKRIGGNNGKIILFTIRNAVNLINRSSTICHIFHKVIMSTRYAWSLLAFGLALPFGAKAQTTPRSSLAAVTASTTTSGGGSDKEKSAVAASPLAFKPDSIFVNPDVRPHFTGGDAALASYMAKNMHYPDGAKQQKTTGKVYIRFVLSTTGRITDASVVRGPGSGLNEEALRLVWLMPPWQPGYQRGQAVRVVCTMPIEFQL
jgi:protein TonB